MAVLLDGHMWLWVHTPQCMTSPGVMVGRVASLMFIVDSTVQWCISSEMCWVALLDRFTLACGRTLSNWSCILLSMVGWVAPLVSVADSAPCWLLVPRTPLRELCFFLFVCLLYVHLLYLYTCIPDGLT